MTKLSESLWSNMIRATIRSPLTILRVQADILEQITGGLLEGKIESRYDALEATHSFYVVAPAAEGYRKELFSVSHDKELPYPAKFSLPTREVFGDSLSASSEHDFVDLLHKILSSDWLTSLLMALIAKSNEVLGDAAPREDQPPPAEAGDEGATPEGVSSRDSSS